MRQLKSILVRDYNKPKDFENYLYVSQLLQAEGIKTGIEAHRRNRHRCMGSLYWQLNDCWPKLLRGPVSIIINGKRYTIELRMLF